MSDYETQLQLKKIELELSKINKKKEEEDNSGVWAMLFILVLFCIYL